MIPAESVTTFLAASFLLGLSPGPDKLYIITHSALFGRRGGIIVTAGLCAGLVCHTTFVAFGVSAVLMASAPAFTALKLAGTFYLVFLAWKAFRSSSAKTGSRSADHLSTVQLFGRGIVMNLINPAILIFFFAFLPQFVVPEQGAVIQQIYMLGGLFIIVTFLLFSVIAMAAGSIQNLFSNSPKAQVYLQRMSGVVFLGLAGKLLIT